jgi:hypothetical protein
MLCKCNVLSICLFLDRPFGWETIESNAVGCNSIEEVQDSCGWVSIEEIGLSKSFDIYPNPSSGEIHLRYMISDMRYSIFELYSIQGIKVRTLLEQVQQTGEHVLTFDISDLPAGMYFVRMQMGKQVETAKFVLLR